MADRVQGQVAERALRAPGGHHRQGVLGEDPLSDTLFVFFNRRGNYMKLVTWDRTGYCLFAKKLEQGRFRLPSGETKQEISERAFRLILDGIVLGNRRRIC